MIPVLVFAMGVVVGVCVGVAVVHVDPPDPVRRPVPPIPWADRLVSDDMGIGRPVPPAELS